MNNSIIRIIRLLFFFPICFLAMAFVNWGLVHLFTWVVKMSPYGFVSVTIFLGGTIWVLGLPFCLLFSLVRPIKRLGTVIISTLSLINCGYLFYRLWTAKPVFSNWELICAIAISLLILELTFTLLLVASDIRLNDEHKENEEFDKEGFIPDTTYRRHFPWEQVKACIYEVLPMENFKNHENCPKCGMHSEKLFWIEYTSPALIWRKLSGKQGPLSICPKCKIQVEFIEQGAS